jgi:hypothetical protein
MIKSKFEQRKEGEGEKRKTLQPLFGTHPKGKGNKI